MVMLVESKRQMLERMRQRLELERSSFETHQRDLGEYYLPMRPRFQATDQNNGARLNDSIIDSTGIQSAEILRSGMMAGITSPARPWKRLTTPDPALSEDGPIKDWLHLVDQRMDKVFAQSNLYDSLQELYLDLIVFGTAAAIVEEDFFDTIHVTTLPPGTYLIANDRRRRVNVCVRVFRVTVRQLVEEFGKMDSKGSVTNWKDFSTHARELWERNDRETWIDVCHAIYPNDAYDDKAIGRDSKKFASCYYEIGTASGLNRNYLSSSGGGMIDDDKFLRESGYERFPVIVLRWSVSGSDVYATNCPGMTALGDVKQLQLMERDGMKALQKMIDPPLNVPASLRNAHISILPAARNHVPEGQHGLGVRPVHEVNIPIDKLEMKEEQIRQRIRNIFYVDLFLMFAGMDREMTAREVAERQQEKLLVLGPVLERLHRDGLKPLIDITFDIMWRQGQFSDLETPPALENMDLKIEYISILAQAQRAVGVGGLERLLQVALQLATLGDPTILLKIDFQQLIDEYAQMTGTPPRVIRTDEHVQALEVEIRKAQQAQMAAEQAKNMTGAVKDLSQSPLEGDSALSRLLEGAGGNKLMAA